jgi:hypothetical protein
MPRGLEGGGHLGLAVNLHELPLWLMILDFVGRS